MAEEFAEEFESLCHTVKDLPMDFHRTKDPRHHGAPDEFTGAA